MTHPSSHGEHLDRNTPPATGPDWAQGAFEPPQPTYGFTEPRPGYPYPPQQRQPYGAAPPKVHTGLAVLAAILFAPLGIYALVLNGQVNARSSAGDLVGALEASNKARTVSIAGIIVGGLISLLFCMGACSALMSSSYYY